MSFETLYAKSFDDGIARTLATPGPAPENESFSLWSMLGAGARGIPAAALEIGGSAMDILGSSAVESARRPRPAALRDQPDDQARRDATAKWVNEAGPIMRNRASEMGPDPLTSHTADGVLFGLTKSATKAVTAVGTLGPVAGAAALAAEGTNTAYQRLKDSGLDKTTALKAGATEGVIGAVGAVLPMGGSTIARTLGLVALGGPGAYMAQEGLARKILEAYPDEARKHDPTDGMGLALSIAIPGMFGGAHLYGMGKRAAAVETGRVPLAQMNDAELKGLKYNDARLDDYAVQVAEANGVPPSVLLAVKNAGERSGSKAVSPKGAQGVMQFMPETWAEIGVGDRQNPMLSINAGGAYLRKLYDQYGSWDAAVAHYNGGGKMAADVLAGKAPHFPETAKYLERVQAYVADHTARTAARDPDAVAAARVRVTNDALARSLPDHPDAFGDMQKATDEIAAGNMPDVRPMPTTSLPEFKAWFGDSKVVDESGRPLVVYHGTTADIASFDSARIGQSMDSGKLGRGFYFTTNPELASRYANPVIPQSGIDAPNVLPAHLALQNPLQISAKGADIWTKLRAISKEWGVTDDPVLDKVQTPNPEWSAKFAAAAQREGHDGVSLLFSDGHRELVAFAPEQVKSAIGNSGKFDRNSASLTDPLAPGEVSPRSRGTNTLPDPNRLADTTASTKATAAPPSIDSQRMEMMLKDNPDMPVKMPGSDTTVTLREAMSQAADEAAFEKTEANLYQAAVDCALSFGA